MLEEPHMPTPTGVFVALFALGPAVATLAQPDPTAAQLYRARCATCHGESGHPDAATRKTTTPAYDFTSCSVASAEPDTAWLVAVTKGGPAVGLSAEMPDFDRQLSAEQIRDVVTYLRWR